MQSGLYIVGTPIGNLGDMSPRAVETLRRADLIACEDTRVFSKLASHFDIKTKKVSLHEYNERDELANVTKKIEQGMTLALVSDSGMPTISDPGFRLVRECRARSLPVFVVPGPTAVISALALSGFPTDRFTFCGFFKDEKHLREDNKIRHTIVYYESPNRVQETVGLLARVMPERRVAIVREITKIHEETIIGYPSELGNIGILKGEIVLVIEPAPDKKLTDVEISQIVRTVLDGGYKTKEAANMIAEQTGMSKSEAYEKVIGKR